MNTRSRAYNVRLTLHRYHRPDWNNTNNFTKIHIPKVLKNVIKNVFADLYFHTTYYQCCLKRYLIVHSSSYKKKNRTYATCKKVSTPPKFTVQTQKWSKNIWYRFRCIWHITTSACILLHIYCPWTPIRHKCEKKKGHAVMFNMLLIHWKCKLFSASIFPWITWLIHYNS